MMNVRYLQYAKPFEAGRQSLDSNWLMCELDLVGLDRRRMQNCGKRPARARTASLRGETRENSVFHPAQLLLILAMIIRVGEDLTQRRKGARAQRRQPFFASLGLCVFAFLPVLAQDQADQIARARELLRQSREAIGETQAWEQLQTLSAS